MAGELEVGDIFEMQPLIDILDSGAKKYDDHICAMPSRLVERENAVRLALIRAETVQAAREYLDRWISPDPFMQPIETGMIAEILFNVRFLYYIHEKCGDRKSGWVVLCKELIDATWRWRSDELP